MFVRIQFHFFLSTVIKSSANLISHHSLLINFPGTGRCLMSFARMKCRLISPTQRRGDHCFCFDLNKASAGCYPVLYFCRCLQFVDFEVRTGPRGARMTLLQSRPKRRALLPSVARTLPCWQPEAHQLMQSLCVKRTRRSRRESVQGWQWTSGAMVARAPSRIRLFSLRPSLAYRCDAHQCVRREGRKFVHLVRMLPDFQQSCW